MSDAMREMLGRKIDEQYNRINELENEINRLKIQKENDFKVIKELRIIRGLAEARYIDAESMLDNAKDTLKHFPESEAIFDEPHEGMFTSKGLFFPYTKVEKWKLDMKKALGGKNRSE